MDAFLSHIRRKLQYWGKRFARWWLNLTSSKDGKYQTSIWDQREHQRRSELASWLILILLVCDLCATLTGVYDLQSLISVVAIGGMLLLAAVLNRLGQITAVGWLLTLGLIAALLFSITPEGETIPAGALDKDALPIYDLLAIPLAVSMSLLKPRTGAWVAALNIVLMSADFVLQPHTPALEAQILSFGSIRVGTAVMLVRPVILQLAVVVIANLWVRGVLQARLEALRAKQGAELERRYAEFHAQQVQAMEDFVEQAHSAIRQGQSITLPPDHPFRELAELLNMYTPPQHGPAENE